MYKIVKFYKRYEFTQVTIIGDPILMSRYQFCGIFAHVSYSV
jgi:hypothetical protein